MPVPVRVTVGNPIATISIPVSTPVHQPHIAIRYPRRMQRLLLILLSCCKPAIPLVARHPGVISPIAIPHLIRRGVNRQGVRIRPQICLVLPASSPTEQRAETVLFLAVPGGVVVCGGRSEPFLSLAVAGQGEVYQAGEGEEDAWLWVSVSFFSRPKRAKE